MTILIALNGVSGSGKTTILDYLRPKGFHGLGTGDFFKAHWGLVHGGHFAHNRVTGDDAIRDVFDNMDIGLEEYSRVKEACPQLGQEMIRFIEAHRALCPDLPSRSLMKYVELYLPDLLLTEVLNLTELEYLVGLVNGSDFVDKIFFYGLDCVNPRPMESSKVAHNRSRIAPSEVMATWGESVWHSFNLVEDLRYDVDNSIEIVAKTLERTFL